MFFWLLRRFSRVNQERIVRRLERFGLYRRRARRPYGEFTVEVEPWRDNVQKSVYWWGEYDPRVREFLKVHSDRMEKFGGDSLQLARQLIAAGYSLCHLDWGRSAPIAPEDVPALNWFQLIAMPAPAGQDAAASREGGKGR